MSIFSDKFETAHFVFVIQPYQNYPQKIFQPLRKLPRKEKEKEKKVIGIPHKVYRMITKL